MKKRILIVEDQEEVRQSFVRLLEKPYEVYSVASGERGIALLWRESRFDLILTDVDMPPGISGVEFVRIAQANELIPDTTKIAIMTGNVTPELRAICVELGAAFFHKPIRSIIPTIAKLLEE